MATTTNYGWTTPDNTAYVKDGASAIRTLGSSVDTSLFSVTGGKNVGLQYIATGTATAQNRLNISSCFTSAYSSYRVVVTNLTHSTANNLFLRFSVAGTDTAGSAYNTQRLEIAGGAATPVNLPTASNISPSYVASSAGSFAAFSFDVINPQAAAPTNLNGLAWRYDAGAGLYTIVFGGLQDSNTQFDGISLVGNTGNISCTMKVYGYRN
jgi:hypothetical protein